MKKYLNKGLLYEWFNAGKVPILLGIITWGFIAQSILKSNVMRVKSDIARAESSCFYTENLEAYFILGIIFLAIYAVASGINKRNTMMFLCSGPYTKRQIKINELICLLITLGLFIITYLYIAFTIYIKYSEIMYIITEYPQVILIEVIRFVLFGISGILLLLLIDLLFSNSIMAYLGMIALGLVTLIIFEKFTIILSYAVNHWGYIRNAIFGSCENDGSSSLNIFFCGGSYNKNQMWQVYNGIILLIIIIGIMLVAFNILERKSKLETAGKIFSNKSNEKIIVTYLSLGIGTFTNIIFTERTINKMIYKTGDYQPLIGSDLFKILAIDIISIVVISFIAYKILKKILKIIS